MQPPSISAFTAEREEKYITSFPQRSPRLCARHIFFAAFSVSQREIKISGGQRGHVLLTPDTLLLTVYSCCDPSGLYRIEHEHRDCHRADASRHRGNSARFLFHALKIDITAELRLS